MSGGVRVVGAPGAPSKDGREGEALLGGPTQTDVPETDDMAEVADAVEIEDDAEYEAEYEFDDAVGPELDDRPTQHRAERPGHSRGPKPSGSRRRLRVTTAILSVVAVLGVAGTVGFGLAWGSQNAQAQAASEVRSASSRFLTDLTNFDAKTVDADFAAITGMATGTFAGQARTFFNSAIRQELEDALASSRGQIRSLYVESISGSRASTYAVVDQLYANNKVTAPQSDVLRIVLDLADTGSGWKVSDVTVLQGPTAASGSAAASTPASSTPASSTPASSTPASSTPAG